MLLPVHLNGRLERNGRLCVRAVYQFFVAGGARLLLNIMFDFCCLRAVNGGALRVRLPCSDYRLWKSRLSYNLMCRTKESFKKTAIRRGGCVCYSKSYEFVPFGQQGQQALTTRCKGAVYGG